MHLSMYICTSNSHNQIWELKGKLVQFVLLDCKIDIDSYVFIFILKSQKEMEIFLKTMFKIPMWEKQKILHIYQSQ